MRLFIVPPVVLALCLCLGLACETSDVGAPCSHGAAEPQDGLTVTFPALSCSELVCIYSDDNEPPSGSCDTHDDCNPDIGSQTAFLCRDGRCTVTPEQVLEHSMCSQFCVDDSECGDGDPGTNCQTGFACVAPQDLGPYCCEKMCVCRDALDLVDARERTASCEAGTHAGCCLGADKPAACGPAPADP